MNYNMYKGSGKEENTKFVIKLHDSLVNMLFTSVRNPPPPKKNYLPTYSQWKVESRYSSNPRWFYKHLEVFKYFTSLDRSL